MKRGYTCQSTIYTATDQSVKERAFSSRRQAGADNEEREAGKDAAA